MPHRSFVLYKRSKRQSFKVAHPRARFHVSQKGPSGTTDSWTAATPRGSSSPLARQCGGPWRNRRVMHMKLEISSGRDLTSRWHDETLDLESLAFDKKKGTTTFVVIERIQLEKERSKWFFQKRTLNRCTVKVSNVSAVEVLDAEGEAELYIQSIVTSANSLRIRCTNGTVALMGEGLEVDIQITPLTKQIEGSCSTPLGEISWRRKQK